MSLNVTLILGAIFAFIATIAAYIFVIPEKKRRSLNKFLRTLHDIFNLKAC